MAVSDAQRAWRIADELVGDIAGAIEDELAEARAPLEAEVERLNAAADMLAAEREAWKTRAEAAEWERDAIKAVPGGVSVALGTAKSLLEMEKGLREAAEKERDEARDDSLRLHREKCDFMERAIYAEARLARARADALREDGIMPVWFGQTPDGVDRDSWLKGAEQAISAYCKAIRALADSEPSGREGQP